MSPLSISFLRSSLVLVLCVGTACQADKRIASLLRLRFIDETLQTRNEALLEDNLRAARAIRAQTERNLNFSADTLVLYQAQAVHDSTKALVNHLRELHERLRRSTGNEIDFLQLDERRTVAQVLIGGTGRSAADSLQEHLHRHARFLRQLTPAPTRSAEAPPAQVAKVLPAFDFSATPVVAALAAISERETRALLYEGAVLEALRAKINSNIPKSSIRALATAETRTVAPGDTYRANLYLMVAYHTEPPMKMTLNGIPIAVDAEGFGQIAFVASTTPGVSKRRALWVGAITHRMDGRDTTFQVRVPYTVAR